MPFKDADYNREYQRAHATRRREEKRLLLTNDPTTNPLLVIGERWMAKWVKQGEQLLANHSDEAIAARAERNRAKVRRHKEKYPDRVSASNKRSYRKHRATRRREARQRYDLNREAENERSRVYYGEHAEEIKAQKKPYRLEHAAHLRAKYVEWCIAHAELIVGYSATRRARKLNAPINDFTPEQWLEIQAAFSYRCAYCPPDCKACKNKTHKLTQDHITPLSKGGPNTASNIVPACKSHNSKKYNGPPLCPVQPLLLTVAPSQPYKAS